MKSMLKKKLASSFNTWSKNYTADVVPKLIKRGYSYEILAKKILEYLDPDYGAAVAELGVGSGILGKAIKEYRPDLKIIGFDISIGMINEAKKYNVYDDLFLCDAEHIPIKNCSFNYIYTAFMMHSVLNMRKGLTELRRIVSPNAKIALIDLFRSKPKIPILSYILDNYHSIKYEFGAPSNYFSMNEFKSLVDDISLLNIISSKKLDLRYGNKNADSVKMQHYFIALQTSN